MIIEPVWILGVDHQFQMLFRVGLKFIFFFLNSTWGKEFYVFYVPLQMGCTNYCLLVETLKINFSSQNVFFYCKRLFILF